MNSDYNPNWCLDTTLIHAQRILDSCGVIASPLIPAVAYAFPTTEHAASVVSGKKEGIYYGRYGNPTTRILEEKIATLENGEASLAVSSGMAAISIALLAFLKSGDHVLTTKDVYGGTYKFLTSLAPRFGIEFDFIDCTNFRAVEDAIKSNTKVLYLETPSNPCLTLLDIEGLTDIAHKYGLKVIIDNTFMTPYLQKPIDLGADVVVHSATKYLNGHGDVIAGIIVGKSNDIEFMRKNVMGDLGQHLSAWDSFLILRGLKTLGLRIRQHCENAMKIARFLEEHSAVERVYYPGLKSNPQHSLAVRQMKGFGGIVSFVVKGGLEAAREFINELKLVMISFSLGDPETLIQHPASMTHFSIPIEKRKDFGISDGLIRLSTGLEDVNDIIKDLDQAFSVLNLHSKK